MQLEHVAVQRQHGLLAEGISAHRTRMQAFKPLLRKHDIIDDANSNPAVF